MDEHKKASATRSETSLVRKDLEGWIWWFIDSLKALKNRVKKDPFEITTSLPEKGVKNKVYNLDFASVNYLNISFLIKEL